MPCPFPKNNSENHHDIHHLRLITIGVSHFCEKARWALDLLQDQSLERASVASSTKSYDQERGDYYYYTEDAHAPPFVSFFSVPASMDQASQTPMVIFTDKHDNNDNNKNPRILVASTTITRELCPFLYPEPYRSEIEQLEEDFGHRLGATARCVVYHQLLQPEYHDACRQVCGAATTSSNVEAMLFNTLLDKGVAKAMRKMIVVNDNSSAASLVTLRQVFAQVSDRLVALDKNNKNNENNQTTRDTYLVGNQFTAADLTWAALAYPVLQPAETASLMGYIQDGQMPPALRELRNELRVTRAGQHALQMYQRHRLTQRGNETAPRVVTLRSIGRNQWGGVRRFGTWAVGVGIVAMAARQAWDMWN